MAHIIPLFQAPTLAISRDIVFGGTYLGHEVHLHEGYADYGQQVADLRQAAAGLALSADSNKQLLRKRVDDRFVADTAGAPSGWPFGQENGSITTFLAEAYDQQIIQFCDWHREHFHQLQAAISSSMPEMLARSRERLNRLQGLGLLSVEAADTFMSNSQKLIDDKKVGPIDSFDGSLVEGLRSRRGIYLSHRFDAGYHIGAPTQRYWHLGFHELGHETVSRSGTPFHAITPLEDVLIEHFTSVSSDTADRELVEDIYRTADTEAALYYVPLRKLFGIMLAQKPCKLRAGELAPLLTSNRPELLRQVQTQIENGFDRVFPEHAGGALSIFLMAYASAPYVRKGEMIGTWLGKALERVGPPEPTNY